MSGTLRIEILSPEGSVCALDAKRITLPTTTGEITVLPGHVPIFTRLAEGEIAINDGEETTYVAITGGFLELSEDTAVILADYAVKSDTIVSARAEEAKQRAEEAMRTRKNAIDFVAAEQDLKKSLLQLKVSGRVKKRTRPQK
ncbi:MAG: ATP synthase F1 subunit epsilon [Elusimicrobia bacterium]|nr:ATP synthase F1 subunit epsilon [Elusimicrobiota bacterium]